MPKVFYSRADGSTEVVDGAHGDSVMQTAVRNGVDGIVGQCGGSLSCATCHVYLAEDELADFPPISEVEDEMLDCTASEREPCSRLSCQLILVAGRDVHVTVPQEQL